MKPDKTLVNLLKPSPCYSYVDLRLIFPGAIPHDDEITRCARLLTFGHVSHVVEVYSADEPKIAQARVNKHQERENERASWRRKNDESDLPPAV